MTSQFEFKPAPLSSLRQIELHPEGVTERVDGEIRTISYDDLIHVRFWTISAQRIEFTGLDLTSGTGEIIEIRMNFPHQMPENDPTFLAFKHMLVRVLEEVHAARPELKVELGSKGWVRWSIFLMGAGLLLFGLVVGLMVMLGSPNRLGEAALPLGLSVLLGAFLSFSFWPLGANVSVDAPRIIEALRGTPDD